MQTLAERAKMETVAKYMRDQWKFLNVKPARRNRQAGLVQVDQLKRYLVSLW